MPELHHNERLIINQLIDQGVFTSTATRQMMKQTVEAIQALKRPQVQQRVTTYLRDLVGMGPENYQENLIFLLGAPQLEPETVHVLLATLKAVINLPEMQAHTERIVPVQTIVRQVHSEVVELEEKEVLRQITALFVDRFKLFVSDAPEVQNSELPQEVTEFWDVSPDFNFVAQCMVDYLQHQHDARILSPVQRVNRALLTRQFISQRRDPQLWEILQANKETIATQWAQLQRFDFECGETYALLLDRNRRPVTSRAFVVAIAVAQHLVGVGVPTADLNRVIQEVTPLVIGKNVVNSTEVKKALLINSLIFEDSGFYRATALVRRFDVAINNEEDAIHATE